MTPSRLRRPRDEQVPVARVSEADDVTAGSIRLAVVQTRSADDRSENLASAAASIDAAAVAGAQLVMLPEIFSAPFVGESADDDYFRWAEPIDGPSNAMVRERAAAHGITVMSSIFEETAVPGVYHNTACVFEGDRLVCAYRKSHLPFSNGFPEKYYFRPGDEAPPVFDVGPARVGLIVCYERHFPELGRLVALGGAALMCVPAACASAPTREVFRLELRAHAVFNSMYVACANRVGVEGTKDYYGSSAIYGPSGDTVAEAGSDSAQVLVADIDVGTVIERRRRLPYLRDRRPALYRSLSDHHD